MHPNNTNHISVQNNEGHACSNVFQDRASTEQLQVLGDSESDFSDGKVSVVLSEKTR